MKYRVSDAQLDALEAACPKDKQDNAFIQGSRLLIADLKDARAEIRRLEALLCRVEGRTTH